MIQFTDLLEFRVPLFLISLKNPIFKGYAEYPKWACRIWSTPEHTIRDFIMRWAVCI